MNKKKLSFSYLISSAYKINNNIKAANFIIKVCFLLTEKKTDSHTEDRLSKIALQTSKDFDHKFLNTEKGDPETKNFFDLQNLSIEDLAKAYFDKLYARLQNTNSQNLNQNTNPLDSVEVQKAFVDKVSYNNKTFVLSTEDAFSAVHRHYNLDLSEAENKVLYKKCSVEHGHEYKIRLFVKSKILKKNKFYKVIDLSQLKFLLKKEIIKPLHGSYLNSILGNTSGEVLVKYCYKKLQPFFLENDFAIELQETRKNTFFYPAAFL